MQILKEQSTYMSVNMSNFLSRLTTLFKMSFVFLVPFPRHEKYDSDHDHAENNDSKNYRKWNQILHWI